MSLHQVLCIMHIKCKKGTILCIMIYPKFSDCWSSPFFIYFYQGWRLAFILECDVIGVLFVYLFLLLFFLLLSLKGEDFNFHLILLFIDAPLKPIWQNVYNLNWWSICYCKLQNDTFSFVKVSLRVGKFWIGKLEGTINLH